MVFLKKKMCFQDIIDLIAQEDDGRFHSKMAHRYSPTELTGCMRNSWFSRKFPVAYDRYSFRNFLLGNILHDVFQHKFKDKVFLEKLRKELGIDVVFVDNERAFQYLIPPHDCNNRRVIISGRLDTIFYLRGEDVPYVVDYKSTANSKYNENQAKLDHIKQVNFYMGCTLSERGSVVYIDKRNLHIVQHDIVFDLKLFDDVVNNAVLLDNALSVDKCPVVDVDIMKNNGCCAYCKYKDMCKEEEEVLSCL
jgi:hypothetical protein